MKQITSYIQEGLRINKNIKVRTFSCQPKNRTELIDILTERLKDNKNANLNDIDISKVWDMSGLFSDSVTSLDPHNIDISQWDVSHVKNMSEMFYDCENFNCDLSNWDVSNVKDMSKMFVRCYKFKSDISNWDISNVERWNLMFHGTPLMEKYPQYRPKFHLKPLK